MKRRFWTADWFTGLVLTLTFMLAADSAPVAWLDGRAYDLVASLASAPKGEAQVAVIGIGEGSLEKLGPWPWPRDRLAELVENLDGVRTTGLAVSLQDRQYVHLPERLDALWYEARTPGERLLLERLREKLSTDERLSAVLELTGSLVGAPAQTLPSESGFTPRADSLSVHRLPSLIAAGPVRITPSKPGGPFAAAPTYPMLVPATARALPLSATVDGHVQPTFAAALIAASLKVSPESLEFVPGRPVKVGPRSVPVDWGGRFYPRYGAQVPVHEFSDVFSDGELRRSLAGKTVLIGLTAPEVAGGVRLPDGTTVAPVIALAAAVGGALSGAGFDVPGWALGAQFGALFAVGLFLMFLLPRLRRGTGFVLTALVALLLANAHFLLMSMQFTWVPLMAAAALLLAGYVVVSLKHLVRDRFAALRLELSAANRQLARVLHGQGQLDAAFEKYRGCVIDDALLEQLYELGLDYERKRRFDRAASLFDYLHGCRKGFRDAKERAKRNREMEDVVVLGGGAGASPTGTVIMSAEGLQKPVLGRYEVERELGRGAMGLVYLGRDPKIGRTVAIKTMALSREFEDEALVEVRERFFREAETAGRLDHPNIVTVYDAGEEQDLAYIAMDYLKGVSLAEFCKPDNLLPPGEALRVAAQVADALDYAHSQNVVHRDVKPANIIYDRDSGTVKVTDFGVACLTDSSKTKTGTVLGSPSYMSPEQFAGIKVDGRSDIFSLGVTLFQLLTGKLPFTGDSFPTLMYRIANEKHPDVRKLRKGVPACVSRIINKALQKEAERRYLNGAKFAEALRRCAGE